MIGNILGGYRLEKQLGSGAFGTVYLARHVDMDWVMAVKVARERRFGEMIREEGRLLARLRHPNVVRVQHMETSGDTPFVVVEYVDGESLAQMLRRGAIEPGRVLELARQLLAGLAAAHELGILHRDIKPSNVLIAGDGTVKLADFGLGRVAEQQSLTTSMAGSLAPSMMRSQVSQQMDVGKDEIVGTIAYMAPEQMRGEEVDNRADLYSLGVVLYEALTCELPVGRFELPGELVSDVPEILDCLVERLLAPRPAKRPSGAAAARALLSHTAVLTPPIEVRPPSLPRQSPATRPPAAAPLAPRSVKGAWLKHGSRAGEEVEGPDGGVYVWVPSGEFTMGTAVGALRETPEHQVRITKGFWVGKYPVTAAQYNSFRNTDGSTSAADLGTEPDHPVVAISWEDALTYCNHFGLALPTEAEWEYVARGTSVKRYPWGDEWLPAMCCHSLNRGPYGSTFPVGNFPEGASWCGALDMAGNVWEWCADRYDGSYYRKAPLIDPIGPQSGRTRVLRGGSWSSGYSECRSVERACASPSHREDVNGFRCVVRSEAP